MKPVSPLINKITPVKFFYACLFLLVGATLIQLPIADGKAFFSLLHNDVHDTFMDFFNSVYDAGFANPYAERGVIYPPLAYLFYRICAFLLPKGIKPIHVRNMQSGIVVGCVLSAVFIYLLYKIFIPKNADKKTKYMVLTVLLASVPFWFAVERGNLVLPTLIALAYFVKNYKSENKIKREIALICLAIATSFKIYPVFFGILLLTDKRYKEAVRCVIYGIAVFFLPFLFFGGFSSFFTMLENIMSTSNDMLSRGWGFKVNIDNTIFFLSEAFHIAIPGATIIKAIFALIIVFITFFSRKNWQKYMALSSIMIIFPSFSYTYALIFAVIPLFAFLFDNPKVNTRNLLFSFFFVGMFAPFPLDGERLFDSAPDYYYPLNLTTLISSICILLMLVCIVVDIIYSYKEEKHQTLAKTVTIGGNAISVAYIKTFVFLAVFAVLLGISYIYCNNLYNLDQLIV